MAFVATPGDHEMAEYLAQFHDDPLGYAMAVFPWGKSGTILADEEGPDKWQSEFLIDLGQGMRDCLTGEANNVKMATASGYGIGKTCLVSWIIKWFMSTRPHPQIVVTANTGTQLATKTWRELAKWNKVAIDGHWFEWTATSFKFKQHPETWVASAIPWSEHNSEAFAGTHDKHVMMLFDEASKIHDSIWNIASGILTERGAVWLAFGNPTQNTGRFHSIFHKERKLWNTRSIDSRTAKITDKKELNDKVALYGEDDDIVRVGVLGKFPHKSSMQFIATDLVERAMEREHKEDAYRHAAKVLAVDVARFGDDSTVFCVRKGLKVLWMKEYNKLDTMQTAQLTAEYEDKEKPDAVFVDVVGIGAGVVDRGRQLGRLWIEHNGAHKSSERKYSNKRAQCWGRVEEWLETADITALSERDSVKLQDDLTGPRYGFDRIERILLEKKEDMKKRELSSPDWGDALAMTFTQTVRPRKMIQDEYDYEEAERQRQRQSADNTKNSITGY